MTSIFFKSNIVQNLALEMSKDNTNLLNILPIKAKYSVKFVLNLQETIFI